MGLKLLKYSIIIPTYNGADKLKRCLTCITKLKKPKDDFEVIVINNGSTDNTEEIVKEFDFVRYFYDATPGLHVGRHLGAKEAKGEILCYLDDDSFVFKDWLLGIEETFKDNSVLIAAGNNHPLFEKRPPKWLKYFWRVSGYGRWMGELSLIELRNRKMRVPAWFVFGCNFIIRKDTLYECGGFNPDGMPKEFLYLRGDGETALSYKLNSKGIPAYFNPKINIYHSVPASRMTKEYFEKRAFAQGISDSYSDVRKNKYDYYNIEPKNIDEFKTPFLMRKINKYLTKHPSKEYLSMLDAYNTARDKGYSYHQNALRERPELKDWVFKENYL